MKKLNRRDRWQSLVHRAISHERRISRIGYHASRQFKEEEIGVLLQLEDSDIEIETILKDDDFLKVLQNASSKFIEQCLWTSMGTDRKWFEDQFVPLYNLLQTWIIDGIIITKTRHELLEAVLLHLIESEDVNCMQVLFSNTRHHYPPKTHVSSTSSTNDAKIAKANTKNFKKINNIVLMRACERNNFDIVRLLILAGYRFKSNCNSVRSCKKYDLYKNDTSLEENDGSSWNNLPKTYSSNGKIKLRRSGVDHLNELKILRMMTKPVYIMAQYVATLEASKLLNDETGEYHCDCHTGQGEDDFHFCPASVKFMVSNFCEQHIECNDPIFICFDIAKLCHDFGEKAPEYGEECKILSNDLIDFSVNLLDHCCNIEEVELLLSEKAGLSKYMRFVGEDLEQDGNLMFYKHPRLTLATELNYKQFVGHMHCQQILRLQWHGKQEWENKSFLCKAFYVIKICLLAPLNLGIAFVVFEGKQIYAKHAHFQRLEEKDGSSNINKSVAGHLQGGRERYVYWLTRGLRKYGEWANQFGEISQDIPFNRFIVYTLYYILFISLLARIILDPCLSRLPVGECNCVYWNLNHSTFTIFVISLILSDVQGLLTNRSIMKVFKQFWRLFDIVTHFLLGLSVICNWILYFIAIENDCWNQNEDHPFQETYRNKSVYDDVGIGIGNETVASSIGMEEIFHQAYMITFATGSTLALFRIVYWLQLNRRVGPVVINITRVAFDLVTIISTYLATLAAFSLGILFVLNSKLYKHGEIGASNKTKDNSTLKNERPEDMTFIAEIMVMFWALLNPGPDPETIPDIGISGIVANILFAIYQVINAIILLNLLIAMMNSTMQKIEDKKLLYWKFVRTTVWLDFISIKHTFPPPWNLLIAVTFLPVYILGYIIYSFCRLRKQYFRTSNTNSNSLKRKWDSTRNKCVMDPVEGQRRKAHAILLHNLINRYLQEHSRINNSVKSSIQNNKIT